MAIRKSSNSGIPFGNTASRPASPSVGQPYFNGQVGRLELYTDTGWENILQEVPGVTAISGNYLETTNSGTITITGTNFQSGAIASVIGTNGVEVNATSTTFNSIAQVTATFSGLSSTYEPYDVKVTNPSNLFGILSDALNVNNIPYWQTAAGSLGSFFEGVSVSVTATALDDSTITYSLASGSSLPSGLTLNSSTGVISGTLPNISSDTTYTFTINASDGLNTAVSRTFSITSLVSAYELLLVAGGGSGAVNDGTPAEPAGGGGAGGLIYISDFTRPGSGTVCTVTIGLGGAAPTGISGGDGGDGRNGKYGTNSTFEIPGVGTLTALGGAPGSVNAGVSGGSGGGAGRATPGAGASTQTVNNLGYLNSGFGNSGSIGTRVGNDSSGGGGGGAGSAATNGSTSTGGNGGSGKLVFGNYYAAGGGGGGTGTAGSGGTGGGGAGGTGSNNGSAASTPGSGGGGAGSSGNARGGAGANGIFVLKHPDYISTLTYSNATFTNVNGYKYYTFTSNGSITF